MITLRELIDNSLLLLPDIEQRLTLQDLRQGIRFKGRGGVYVFYNQYHEPLYVGISNNVGKRVAEHLGGSRGNADLIQYIASGKDIYVDVFYEDSKLYQELYESYLIATINPRFNVGKTDRERI